MTVVTDVPGSDFFDDDDETIRQDDIAPIVRSHAAISANAAKLVAYARGNPNDAGYQLVHGKGGSSMTRDGGSSEVTCHKGGHDGGGAPHKEIVCTAGDDVQSKALESN